VRESGLLVDTADSWGRTMLSMASYHPLLGQLVQHLLRLGGDPNSIEQLRIHNDATLLPLACAVVTASRSGIGGISSGVALKTLVSYGASIKPAMASPSVKRLANAMKTRQINRNRLKGITSIGLIQLLIDEQGYHPLYSLFYLTNTITLFLADPMVSVGCVQ
jgi:hypothetical protein